MAERELTAPSDDARRIDMTVNGDLRFALATPRRLLSDFLRHDLGLTGTHVGCEQGVCGACTVLVDGVMTRSCLTLAVQAEGAEVETIEGVADNGSLHPIQQAFKEKHGLQCGFCTAGMVMTTKSFLEENPEPSREAIRTFFSGNVCRCTGYVGIVDAVEAAAQAARGDGVRGALAGSASEASDSRAGR